MFSRVRGCETDMGLWNPTNRVLSDRICCNNGIYQSCGEPCEPSCVEEQLCDCGLFAAGQFDAVAPGATTLPLVGLGMELGDTTQCAGWPSADNKHTCDGKCIFLGDDFTSTTTLTDEYPNNPALNWGQAMCNMLYGKWLNIWPTEGVVEVLNVHGRMPLCGTYEWNEKIYATHPETLCCDGEGAWQAC